MSTRRNAIKSLWRRNYITTFWHVSAGNVHNQGNQGVCVCVWGGGGGGGGGGGEGLCNIYIYVSTSRKMKHKHAQPDIHWLNIVPMLVHAVFMGYFWIYNHLWTCRYTPRRNLKHRTFLFVDIAEVGTVTILSSNQRQNEVCISCRFETLKYWSEWINLHGIGVCASELWNHTEWSAELFTVQMLFSQRLEHITSTKH